MGLITGLLFVTIILSSIIFGIPVIILPSVLLFTVSLKYSNYLQSLVVKSWATLIIGTVELILRTKIVITGSIDTILSTEVPTVIILNHRTRFDWLYLYAFLARLGSLENHRIILKSSLKRVPVCGHGLQLVPFIFLNRKWADDKEHITDTLFYYCDYNKLPVQLVVFPEGTDLTQSNKQKDDKYAEANGLPLNKYVLHPRTTGFTQCIQTLRDAWKNGEVDVCDITIGYVGEIPQGEKELAKGELPDEVHFHVKHYPSSSLPSTDDEMVEWLKTRWREKEERLESFHKTFKFPGPTLEDTWDTKKMMISEISKWFMLFAIVVYCLVKWPLIVAVVFGGLVIMHCIIDKYTDGWDKLFIKKWKSLKKTQ